MQDNSGLKSFLSISALYVHFQNLVGAKAARKWLATHYWKLQPGEKLVDIGCGPGDVLEDLPGGIRYVGFDLSDDYIKSATLRQDERALFLQGTATDFLRKPNPHLEDADVAVCNGLLHHLNDDETYDVLQLAKRILKPGGRFVCWEPTYLIHQGAVSRSMMARDRGRNVRSEAEWKRIVGDVFPNFTTNIATNLLRLPYIHIIIECRKDD